MFAYFHLKYAAIMKFDLPLFSLAAHNDPRATAVMYCYKEVQGKNTNAMTAS